MVRIVWDFSRKVQGYAKEISWGPGILLLCENFERLDRSSPGMSEELLYFMIYFSYFLKWCTSYLLM